MTADPSSSFDVNKPHPDSLVVGFDSLNNHVSRPSLSGAVFQIFRSMPDRRSHSRKQGKETMNMQN